MAGILAGLLGSFPTASGAYDLITTSLISSNTASVTFSSLPTDYTHLQIRLTGRSSVADYQDNIAIRLNGVTSLGYVSHTISAQGTAVSSGYQDNFGFIFNSKSQDLFGASETSGRFGSAIIDILDFKSTNKNKTIKMLSGVAGGTQVKSVNITSGMRPAATGALTSITLYPRNGSWVSGSRLSIYGIKG